jgi:glutamate synthase (ferredoxin)
MSNRTATETAELQDQRPPGRQGLYDPQYEHDACGVGFVVHVKGRRSHEIIEQALQILINLRHRGACGCEDNTGDGAGILIQMPHEFLAEACAEAGIRLPKPGHYGAGNVFLPVDPARLFGKRVRNSWAGGECR